ncbi:MAG: glycosyltransferase family 39 protein, partial [Anaerolineae bacterium]|nr:glycosyltransferase family 39 protein [Anaerolineae bacterium]
MEKAITQQRDDYGPARGLDRVLVVLPRVNIETALYVLLGVAALVLRLAALGRWPLSEGELTTALAAWRAAKGGLPQPSGYVPLLYDANLFLFALTRASDAAVRLLPALMGALLVIVPYGARDVLGRRGALMASLLLALGPTWLFFSRTAVGTIPAVLASAIVLVWGWRGWHAGSSRTMAWALVALGLGLTAGPGIYTLIASAL